MQFCEVNFYISKNIYFSFYAEVHNFVEWQNRGMSDNVSLTQKIQQMEHQNFKENYYSLSNFE